MKSLTVCPALPLPSSPPTQVSQFSFSMPGTVLPQGLYTGCSVCLELPSPAFPMNGSFSSTQLISDVASSGRPPLTTQTSGVPSQLGCARSRNPVCCFTVFISWWLVTGTCVFVVPLPPHLQPSVLCWDKARHVASSPKQLFNVSHTESTFPPTNPPTHFPTYLLPFNLPLSLLKKNLFK